MGSGLLRWVGFICVTKVNVKVLLIQINFVAKFCKLFYHGINKAVQLLSAMQCTSIESAFVQMKALSYVRFCSMYEDEIDKLTESIAGFMKSQAVDGTALPNDDFFMPATTYFDALEPQAA